MVNYDGGVTAAASGGWRPVPGIVGSLIASYRQDIAEEERPLRSDVPRHPQTSGLYRSIAMLESGADFAVHAERFNQVTGNTDCRRPHTVFDVGWRELMEDIRGVLVRADDHVRLLQPGDTWQYVPGGPVQCPAGQLCIRW